MKSAPVIITVAAALSIAAFAAPAFADHGYGRHDRHHVVRVLPHGYARVHYGHFDYFFHGGHFYRPVRGGFIAVRAPFGAIVTSLPFGYLAIQIGGVHYFTYAGVYYRPVPAGYEVVAVPTPPPAPAPVAATAQSVVVTARVLNVRAGPGASFGIVGQVSRGDNLSVRGNAPGWYYVEMPNGQFGWVMTQYAAPFVSDAQG